MLAKSLQSCLTLCDPINCSLPGSTVHGILYARLLEWVATPSSRGSSRPRDGTRVCIADRFFIIWATRDALLVLSYSSVAQSWPTVCDPVDSGIPGLPVHHQPPEFTQTHVHWVNDTIQPFHPLSSPSPLAFNLSQHQGLFWWVSSLPKYWSFSFNISPPNAYSGLISLGCTGWISLYWSYIWTYK